MLYHNKGTSIFVSMPKNLARIQQHCGLNVTIMSKVVLYAPEKRAEKLPLFPRCGLDSRDCLWKVQNRVTTVLEFLNSLWGLGIKKE
jgi:hypothetical protein